MARTEKATAASELKVSPAEVSKRIYTVRGCQVMLDNDLAEIYNVETRMVKRAVRRNPERFPDDFKFEMTNDELELLRCQIGISNVENFSDGPTKPCLISQSGISNVESESSGRGGNRHTPFAFTELGIAMLSTVLHSPRAIQVNIGIMRVFVHLRKETRSQLDVVPKLESLEQMFKQRFDRLEAQIQSQPASLVSHPSLSAKRDPVSVIQNAVARHFGLQCEDLKSALRTQAISLPRHIAIYLVRKHLCISFSEIGYHFGKRDHSTILHAYHKIHCDADRNLMIRTAVDALGKEIQPLLT